MNTYSFCVLLVLRRCGTGRLKRSCFVLVCMHMYIYIYIHAHINEYILTLCSPGP